MSAEPMSAAEVLAVIDENFVEAHQFRKIKVTDSDEANAEAADCRAAALLACKGQDHER